MNPLTLEQLTSTPGILAYTLPLRDQTSAFMRLLLAEDAPAFGDYLEQLGAETRSRFGPHPLTRAAAHHLCQTLNPAETLRLVAWKDSHIIAYFILQMGVSSHEADRYRGVGVELAAAEDCTLAPSVADAFQNSGLGSQMMINTLEIARRLGRRYMVLMGGTQATNPRAIHFYQKFGFQTFGHYMTDVRNDDMMLVLKETDG